jgi:hypothetical protein
MIGDLLLIGLLVETMLTAAECGRAGKETWSPEAGQVAPATDR